MPRPERNASYWTERVLEYTLRCVPPGPDPRTLSHPRERGSPPARWPLFRELPKVGVHGPTYIMLTITKGLESLRRTARVLSNEALESDSLSVTKSIAVANACGGAQRRTRPRVRR